MWRRNNFSSDNGIASWERIKLSSCSTASLADLTLSYYFKFKNKEFITFPPVFSFKLEKYDRDEYKTYLFRVFSTLVYFIYNNCIVIKLKN